MALYIEQTNNPQTAQSVNVGQFGPSYDSLQDWRSVFIVAEEVRELLEEIKTIKQEVNVLKDNTEEVLGMAEDAANTAQDISDTTRNIVEVGWAEVARLHEEVQQDKVIVTSAETVVTQTFEDTVEKADDAEQFSLNAQKALQDTERLVELLAAVTVTAHYTDSPEPTANFNQATGELQLGIPATLSGTPRGVESIWKDGAYASGPQIKLSASDVGAFAVDGSSSITVPMDFEIAGSQHGFKVQANVVEGQVEFSVLYAQNGKVIPRNGMVLDITGNAAFGGEIYASNRATGARRRVFHEGHLPTPVQLGVMAAGDAYTKRESDAKYLDKVTGIYTQDQVDALLKVKQGNSPLDGKLYASSGFNWIPLSDTPQDFVNHLEKVNTNGDSITALQERIARLESKPEPAVARRLWYGADRKPPFLFSLDKIYTVTCSRYETENVFGSVTFSCEGMERPVKFIVPALTTAGVIELTLGLDGRMSANLGYVREVICHNS